MVLLYEPTAASDHALQLSARVARCLGSEVTVLCLAAHERGAAAHERRLAALAAACLARQGVLARSHVLAATPSDDTAPMAEACQPADLVVVDRSGRRPDVVGNPIEPAAVAATCGRPVLIAADTMSGIPWPPRRLVLLLSSRPSDRLVAVTAELGGALALPVLLVRPPDAWRRSPATAGAAARIADRLTAAGLDVEVAVLDRGRPVASLLSAGHDGLPGDLVVTGLDRPSGAGPARGSGDLPASVLLVPPEPAHHTHGPGFPRPWRSHHPAAA